MPVGVPKIPDDEIPEDDEEEEKIYFFFFIKSVNNNKFIYKIKFFKNGELMEHNMLSIEELLTKNRTLVLCSLALEALLQKKIARFDRLALSWILFQSMNENSFLERLAGIYLLQNTDELLQNRDEKQKAKKSICTLLVLNYLRKRGLDQRTLHASLLSGFSDLLENQDSSNQDSSNQDSFFARIIYHYLWKSYKRAFKALSNSDLDGFADFAERAGQNLIEKNFEILSKTPMSWTTAKRVSLKYLLKARKQESTDNLPDFIQPHFWSGVYIRLHERSKYADFYLKIIKIVYSPLEDGSGYYITKIIGIIMDKKKQK
uniref:Uncharacterized protein n=1 Tax=Wimmerella hederacea TaxID=1929860 RepID=A0A1L6BVX4_9ASTR|nr:hypothetical protein BW171_gp061 [Wimmerella hederacea]APQ40157.1 hypothetical protein Wi_hed1Pt0554 [Wimmerella hederacea]